MEVNSPPSIEQRLEALPKMKRRALDGLWMELFSRPPCSGLRRETLVRILAYRLQEEAFGGLKKSLAKKLQSLAVMNLEEPNTIITPILRPKPGSRIVRTWQGKLYEVEVLSDGYEYDGKKYRSLSVIARAITGTRWSGPLFFGMKRRVRKCKPR